jgi:hypothetical protein
MFGKQIGRFVMVSLKYFFDLDPSFSSHCLLMLFVFTCFFKLTVAKLTSNIHDGLLTIKDTIPEWRAGILTLKERWDNNLNHGTIVNNMRLLKDSFPDIDPRNRRLK